MLREQVLLIDKTLICILKIRRWPEGGYVKKMKFKTYKYLPPILCDYHLVREFFEFPP